MKKRIIYLIMAIAILNIPKVQSQDKKDTLYKNMGVAVSPAHLNFSLRPGASKTQQIKITNDTKKKNKFQLNFKDFDMNENGKTIFIDAGKGKYSLSKWVTISQTFVELEPGEEKKIDVTVNIPATDDGYKAAWCILMVNQQEEKKDIDVKGNEKTIAFGVIPLISFGIYIYQNPPNVLVNKVEIQNFKLISSDTSKVKTLNLRAKNTGDGISFSSCYVELTNTNIGKQNKLLVKKFTILPGETRDFTFDLPDNLEKGKYSAIGVLDFGSNEEIETAEIEFEIK
ncbi:MAG: DUF916 domain-containing protein [Bacteroidales bacterium]|jgi:hypothetical protein